LKIEQKMRLQQLADVTGGEAFFPTTNKALADIFSRIASQVRAQYSLGFISTDNRKDGTWRKLDVHLLGENLQNLTIRTRKGYYAAYTIAPSVPGNPASQK
jgi:VWFA-related protein